MKTLAKGILTIIVLISLFFVFGEAQTLAGQLLCTGGALLSLTVSVKVMDRLGMLDEFED